MSKLGRNPIEDLLIGNAAATETTSDAFVSTASDKELKVISANGSDVGAGKDFKVFQKTATGVEYSGVIIPSQVEKVIVKAFAPEVQKQVTVSGFTGSAKANATYIVEVRLFTDGGDLSPENFTIVSGYYVTGATAGTDAAIQAGIIQSLNNNLKLRGNGEVTVVSVNANSISITGKFQNVVPGRNIGKQIDFEVAAKVYDNVSLLNDNLGTLTTAVTQVASTGSGTGKYAVNQEWFIKGNKYEVFREVSYPANFNTPYYADKDGEYTTLHIRYYDERESPGIEKQSKTLTILVDQNIAAVNAILADLRTIGVANVPANLV